MVVCVSTNRKIGKEVNDFYLVAGWGTTRPLQRVIDLGQKISAELQSTIHSDGIPRRVLLEKASNLRDLGGFETAYGTTQFGCLYRSDQLGLLTQDDVAIITSGLGVTQVVDLRGFDEIEVAGKGPLAEQPNVAYYNIAVSEKALINLKKESSRSHLKESPAKEGSNAPMSAPVSLRYFRRLNDDAPNFKKILLHLADNPMPTIFNCVAGRDRTGLVSMLVLGAAGVSYEDIADDYAATVRIPEEEWGRSRDPKLMEFWKDYVKAVGTTHLETPEDMTNAMLDLLQLLDDDYEDLGDNGIEGYLNFLGVEPEKLRRLLILDKQQL